MQGVSVIDFSPANNLLITGSRDCTIRGWNPYDRKHPIMVLRGHEAPLMYLRVNEMKVRRFRQEAQLSLTNRPTPVHSCLLVNDCDFVWLGFLTFTLPLSGLFHWTPFAFIFGTGKLEWLIIIIIIIFVYWLGYNLMKVAS